MTATAILATVATKTCAKCGETKQTSEFCKQSKSKDGLFIYCRTCQSERNKAYRIANRDALLEKNKAWRTENSELVLARAKRYRDANKAAVNASARAWYIENKEYSLGKSREYRQKNKVRLQSQKNAYKKARRSCDVVYAMKSRLSRLINISLTSGGYTKRSRTHEILGCDYEFFKSHIERQFVKGMTWANRDKWHIDHIRPIASAKTEDDVLALNHFTNLRPMWAQDNVLKADQITHLI